MAGKTPAHRRLEAHAAAWAEACGLLVHGEVRVPSSPYVADVVGAATDASAVVVLECKASRADFLRHGAAEEQAAGEAAAVAARLQALDALLLVHLPEHRRGEALFAACDLPDAELASAHPTRRRLARRLAVVRHRLAGGTKFARLARWRAASAFWLVTAPGLCLPSEVPAGWGWMEEVPAAAELRIRRPAPAFAMTALQRARWVRTLDRRAGRPPAQMEFAFATETIRDRAENRPAT